MTIFHSYVKLPEGKSSHCLQLRINPCHSQLISKLPSFLFWLVVGPPLWKIWKSTGMIIPNIWNNKETMFQSPPTSFDQQKKPDKFHQFQCLFWPKFRPAFPTFSPELPHWPTATKSRSMTRGPRRTPGLDGSWPAGSFVVWCLQLVGPQFVG